MSNLTPTILWIGLFFFFFCINSVHIVEGNASEGSKKPAAKYAFHLSDARYLSPGGEVLLSVEGLTLPEERIMSITFDDGPEMRDLEIMALLKKHNILATFFYIGQKVKAMPEIVEKVLAEKNEIGYHSYQHQRLQWFSSSSLAEDFRQGRAVLNNLGVPLRWFRPPYGYFDSKVIQAAKDQGMETILWTIDSRDWTGISAQTMARNVIGQFHPGAVLLFHSTHPVTLQALPEVLAAAEKENYRFVALGEWRQTVLVANCRMSGKSCPTVPNTQVVNSQVPPPEKLLPPAKVSRPIIPNSRATSRVPVKESPIETDEEDFSSDLSEEVSSPVVQNEAHDSFSDVPLLPTVDDSQSTSSTLVRPLPPVVLIQPVF
ncbi:MAG: polysaccharide deacetylase family protein [Magnetococcus sp. DMHC-6]